MIAYNAPDIDLITVLIVLAIIALLAIIFRSWPWR